MFDGNSNGLKYPIDDKDGVIEPEKGGAIGTNLLTCFDLLLASNIWSACKVFKDPKE